MFQFLRRKRAIETPVRSQNARPFFSTLFILGLGHSGTTLIGRMLAMHPEGICVGELLRLDSALANPDELCSCGERLNVCPFWNRWLAALPPSVKTDYTAWDLSAIEQIRVGEGKQFLTDSSKTRVYRLLRRLDGPRVGFLLMLRDPRGVMRSALRRGRDLDEQLQTHRKWIRRYEAFARKQAHRCLIVHYEDLARSAETELRRVCAFAGLEFMPEMCQPDAKTHHLVRASTSPYLKGADKVAVDQRWREELSEEQSRMIVRQLGRVGLYRRYFAAAPTDAPTPGLPR
jgi:hypothetical protein